MKKVINSDKYTDEFVEGPAPHEKKGRKSTLQKIYKGISGKRAS
jgi:hypothetical protein